MRERDLNRRGKEIFAIQPFVLGGAPFAPKKKVSGLNGTLNSVYSPRRIPLMQTKCFATSS